jgi:hypothetical protein
MDRATDRNELANVIRGLHKKLRKEFRRTGNVESLWMEHMKDENKLKVCKCFRRKIFLLKLNIFLGVC